MNQLKLLGMLTLCLSHLCVFAQLNSSHWSDEGTSNDGRLGRTTASGDFNGDGYNDLIVGEPTADKAHIYYGDVGGLSATPNLTLSPSTTYQFGFSVAAGDLDGDGYDDVAIGQTSSTAADGHVWIYYGSSSGLYSTFIKISTARCRQNFGWSLSMSGDFDGSGKADLAIGGRIETSTGPSCPTAPIVSGVYVFHGENLGKSNSMNQFINTNSADWYAEHTSTNHGFGWSVALVGDMTGDGRSELIVGDPFANSKQGKVFVYGYDLGVGGTMVPQELGVIDGQALSEFGKSLSRLGDIDGDAAPDFIVGAPHMSDASNSGKAYVYSGGNLPSLGGGTSFSINYTNADWPFSSPTQTGNDAHFGWEVRNLGDVNLDGNTDFSVSARGYDNGSNAEAGLVRVYHGTNSSTQPTNYTDIKGANGDDWLGYAVWPFSRQKNSRSYMAVGSAKFDVGSNANAGKIEVYGDQLNHKHQGWAITEVDDINGDGLEDFAVSSPEIGLVEIFTSTVNGYNSTPAKTLDIGGHAGVSMASVDINNDGHKDLLIGDDHFNDYTGIVYVYINQNPGFPNTPSSTLIGQNANEHFGFSIADAGDIAGNTTSGGHDALIGAPGQTFNAGKVYVYADHPSAYTSGSPASSQTLSVGTSLFGHSVAGNAFVNNSGNGHIAVGDPDNNKVYIFEKSGLSLNSTPIWTGEGAIGSEFGYSVSFGTINGDGFSDLVVGAPIDNNSSVGGRVYVWYGESATTTTWPTLFNNAHWNSGNGYGTGSVGTGRFGHAVLASHDLDGDGLDDIAVGNPFNDYGNDNGEGNVSVYGFDNVSNTLEFIDNSLPNSTTGLANHGWSLAAIEDINGDFTAELVIGAPLDDKDGTDDGSFSMVFSEKVASPSMANIGDINGDGLDDFAIGVPSYGKVEIYTTTSSGYNTTPYDDIVLSGSAGVSLACLDFDDDGDLDLLIGDPEDDNGKGVVYVHFRTGSVFSSAPDFKIFGLRTDGKFGQSLAATHYTNGSSTDYLIVGEPGISSNDGYVYLYYASASYQGSSTHLNSGASQFDLHVASSQFGFTVADVKNVDGQNGDDILVGDPYTGKVYLFLESTGFGSGADWVGTHTASSLFGWSISGGDVNGDGYSDIAIGAPTDEVNSKPEGRVYVWYGRKSISNWSSDPANADWNSGNGLGASWSRFGTSVMICESVAGDDLNDLLVGAPNFKNSTHSGHGAVRIYHGSISGLGCSTTDLSESPYTSGTTHLYGGTLAYLNDLDGDGVGEFLVGAIVNNETHHTFFNFGSDITWVKGGLERSAGDVNGDGYGDVISVNEETYQVMVYHGGPTGLSTSPAWTKQFCSTPKAKTAGDIDGDGYSDIIISDPEYNSGDGIVYLYNGSSSGLNSALWRAVGQSGEGLGTDVATIGDIDADGYSDIAVGAPNSGKVYFWKGQTASNWIDNSGKNTSTVSLNIQPSGNVQNFGATLSSAGDVNGDGLSDLIIGDPMAASVYLVLGWGTNSPTIAKTITDTQYPTSQFGTSLSYAGDLNGDGLSDIIIGAPLSPVLNVNNGNLMMGLAYVYLGPHGSWQVPASLCNNILSNPNGGNADQFGYTVSCLGDINADGYSEIAVGSPFAEVNGETNAGISYVYMGGPQVQVNLPLNPTITSTGNAENEYLGQYISGLGDINGDGISEYSHSSYDDATDVWGTIIVDGETSLLTDNPTGTITKSGFYSYGFSVSNAGDVNGDGYDDLLVTAPEDKFSSQSGGVVYVHHGNANGQFNTVPNWTGYHDHSTSLAGFSTASGDVNGDGYSDIVVGTPYFDDRAKRGVVYVFFGSINGISEGNSVDEFQHPYSAGTTPASYVRIIGEDIISGESGLGYDVACMDINGDGYSDIISCIPNTDVSSTSTPDYKSKFYAFLGKSTSDWLNSQVSYSYSGLLPGNIPITYEYILASAADITIERKESDWAKVENAGDIKNDGFSDLMISYGDNVATVVSEYVEVFHGQCNGLSGSSKKTTLTTADKADWKVELDIKNNKFGFAIAGLGDVNGDGFGDIAIGAPEKTYTSTGLGIVYALQGSSTGLPGLNNGNSNKMGDLAGSGNNRVWRVTTSKNEGLGFSVSGAGDVNGLGYNDLVISTKNWLSDTDGDDEEYSNSLYLFAAEENGGFFEKGTVLTTANADWNYSVSSWAIGHNTNYPNNPNYSFYEMYGLSVSSLGDLDGDGFGDIAAGVPYATDNGSYNPHAFYFRGNEALSLSSPTVQFQNNTTSSGSYNIMVQTGTTSDHCGINIGQLGISHLGRSQGELVWETLSEGETYSTVNSNSELLNYYSEGKATSNPALSRTGSFERIQSTFADEFEPNSNGDKLNTIASISNSALNGDLSFRWRCRMQYQPSLAIDGQLYGRWYYPGQGDKHDGNFKIKCATSYCVYTNAPFEEETVVETPSVVNTLVYPNPVQNTLNIENEKGIKRVRVLNLLGAEIMVLNGYEVQKLQVDASSLIQGLYLIEVEDIDGNLHSVKIEK